MALKLRQHPTGRIIPDEHKRNFRSYVDLADYAEAHLPHGMYLAIPTNATNLSVIRLICHEPGRFWVEGRGNI